MSATTEVVHLRVSRSIVDQCKEADKRAPKHEDRQAVGRSGPTRTFHGSSGGCTGGSGACGPKHRGEHATVGERSVASIVT